MEHVRPDRQAKASVGEAAAVKAVNLALQGGGAHGAFAWGVLDRLLEEPGIAFEGISATNAGAMNAAVLAHGLTVGGRAGAREALATFWRRVSERRILLAFEKAETECDPAERRRLLSFVVVGGGPTGVEMAGATAELARRALARDFRAIDPRSARVILIEAGPRLLPAFDARLSEAARRSLEMLGVEVRLGAAVTGCDCGGVAVGPVRIEARTVVWGAGVQASPAGRWLGVATDRAGRVMVGPGLTLPGERDVFVIGDTAYVPGPDGRPLPGIAPVAKQQGRYVTEVLRARAAGRMPAPFRYRDYGALATIGRKRAVAEIGRLRVSGFPAWLLWSLAHVYFLIGFRNRAVVAMTWVWNYVTFQRGTRLITGITGARIDRMKRGAGAQSRDTAAAWPR